MKQVFNVDITDIFLASKGTLGPKGKNVYSFVIVRHDNDLYAVIIMNITKGELDHWKELDLLSLLRYHKENIIAERGVYKIAEINVVIQQQYSYILITILKKIFIYICILNDTSQL